MSKSITINVDASLTGLGLYSKELGWAWSKPIKGLTVNEAEWSALLSALANLYAYAMVFHLEDYKILVQSDSQLVVHQVNGHWRVKKDELKPFAKQAQDLLTSLKNKGVSIQVKHIRGVENGEADRLSRRYDPSETK